MVQLLALENVILQQTTNGHQNFLRWPLSFLIYLFLYIWYVQYLDTVNDTVNDTVLNLIKQDSKITSTEISQQLRISLSTVKRRIKELKESGKIERVGSDKTGHWVIVSN